MSADPDSQTLRVVVQNLLCLHSVGRNFDRFSLNFAQKCPSTEIGWITIHYITPFGASPIM